MNLRDDIDRFYDYSIFVPTSTLYMGSSHVSEDGEESGTDAIMAEQIIKGLHILDKKEKTPITIIMNNIGGDVTAGMAIYDSIKACQNHVTIIVRGQASSMGSVILQAADERVVSPKSRVMIHYGSTGYESHTKNFINWAKEEKKCMSELEDIYLEKIREKHPKYSRESLQSKLNFDTILNAREAVELGLADKIEETFNG